jgi:DNA-binding LytR/AlgR family response regulator
MTKSNYFYRNNGTLQRINLDEVFALETAKNYVKFYTKDGIHIVRTSLETAMKQLKDKGFVQIHRYYAVALEKIHVIDKENVYFSQSKEDNLPITKSYYANLISQLKMIGEDGETDNEMG